MSGTAQPARDPKDNAELARDHERRLKSLENPTSQRVGSWVLSTADNGDLIASFVDGGSVVLATKPDTGEGDPDDVRQKKMPVLVATRTGPQSVPTARVVVQFDGSDVDHGDWTGGRRNFEAVTVPESGDYLLTGTAHFNSSAFLEIAILVDGKNVVSAKTLIGEQGAYADMSIVCVGIKTLAAGQSVGMTVAASNNRTVGVNGTTGTPTMMTVSMIDRA